MGDMSWATCGREQVWAAPTTSRKTFNTPRVSSSVREGGESVSASAGIGAGQIGTPLTNETTYPSNPETVGEHARVLDRMCMEKEWASIHMLLVRMQRITLHAVPTAECLAL